MRFAGEPLRQLIRPAMWEIAATAKAAGYPLPNEEEIIETMIDVDPWSFFKPSMLQDVEKVCALLHIIIITGLNTLQKKKKKKKANQAMTKQGNYTEFENIVGEPLREAQRLGVPTPTLQVIYALMQTIQWKTKEAKGLVTVPPERPAGFIPPK